MGESDDGLNEVMFQQPAPDLRFPGSSPSVEQRRAGQDDGDPSAAVLGVLHLAGKMQEEEHRTVVDTRSPRPESSIEPLLPAFTLDKFLFLLPLLPEGGIG